MNNFNRISELKIKASLNSAGKTVLEDQFFTAPFKIMKPFARDDGGITVYQQSASAGIMAGDQQKHDFFVNDGATLELVSQSFEKIFKMDDGAVAVRNIVAQVGSSALFVYTPLPCMPFAGSAFESKTVISLKDSTSRLVYADCICCGRKAHGEAFDYRYYKNLVEIRRESDCKLIYRDNTIFEGSDCGLFPERKAFMQTPVMYGQYSHSGTMLLFGFGVKPADLFGSLGLEPKLLYTTRNLEEAEKTAVPQVSVTQTEGSGIAIRVLANSAEQVQKIFESVSGWQKIHDAGSGKF